MGKQDEKIKADIQRAIASAKNKYKESQSGGGHSEEDDIREQIRMAVAQARQAVANREMQGGYVEEDEDYTYEMNGGALDGGASKHLTEVFANHLNRTITNKNGQKVSVVKWENDANHLIEKYGAHPQKYAKVLNKLRSGLYVNQKFRSYAIYFRQNAGEKYKKLKTDTSYVARKGPNAGQIVNVSRTRLVHGTPKQAAAKAIGLIARKFSALGTEFKTEDGVRRTRKVSNDEYNVNIGEKYRIRLFEVTAGVRPWKGNNKPARETTNIYSQGPNSFQTKHYIYSYLVWRERLSKPTKRIVNGQPIVNEFKNNAVRIPLKYDKSSDKEILDRLMDNPWTRFCFENRQRLIDAGVNKRAVMAALSVEYKAEKAALAGRRNANVN